MTSSETAGHRVVLERDGEAAAEVAVPEGEALLVAGEEAGEELRFGCREARCASCVGRLQTGSVRYLREPNALTDDQREEGFVLLCSATPTTECRIEVGEGVLADAFPGLWGGD